MSVGELGWRKSDERPVPTDENTLDMNDSKSKLDKFQKECDRLSLNEILSSTREDNLRIMEMLLCEKPPFGLPILPDQEPTAISKLLTNRNAF